MFNGSYYNLYTSSSGLTLRINTHTHNNFIKNLKSVLRTLKLPVNIYNLTFQATKNLTETCNPATSFSKTGEIHLIPNNIFCLKIKYSTLYFKSILDIFKKIIKETTDITR